MSTVRTCAVKLAVSLILAELLLVTLSHYRRRSSSVGEVRQTTDGRQQPSVADNTEHGARTDHASNVSTYAASVAIGLAITTKNSGNVSLTDDFMKMPFFHSLMSSFCRTASDRYDYRFYLAYDADDDYFTKRSFLDEMAITFANFTEDNCPLTSVYSLHFVRCRYAGRPAWSQNDAMIEAYLSGAEYFYRINDDTVMITRNWTERFIDALERFNPPRIGVVGPKHKGGNLDILTYDFTHRTHIDIHGFYYPRQFPDWYADRWITSVYKPGRYDKRSDVLLLHTMEVGRRYNNTMLHDPEVERQVQQDRWSVIRYVGAVQRGFKKRDRKKVVTLSLHDLSSDQTWTVVRNAQLMAVIYPGWTLKVYADRRLSEASCADDSSESASDRPCSRRRITNTLRLLEADVVFVDSSMTNETRRPSWWRYLVAEDAEVDVFVVYPERRQIGERDYNKVNSWLRSKPPKVMFVIRDRQQPRNRRLANCVWGARSKHLRSLLADSWTEILTGQSQIQLNDSLSDSSLINSLKVRNEIVFF